MLPHETKVLLIDDSMHVRLLVRTILKKLGFSAIVEASDGEEGWRLFQEESPNLIFLDQIMPRMNGVQVLMKIREENPDTRVIILSSLSSAEKILQVKEIGANHYILKPFTREKISDVLSELGWQMHEEARS
ncbi:response regulator [bacterium]|nr:response regulator [bacterium]